MLPQAAGAPPDASRADPHQALQPLIEAAALTQARVAVLPVPMHWRERPWLPDPVTKLLKALSFLGPHAASGGTAVAPPRPRSDRGPRVPDRAADRGLAGDLAAPPPGLLPDQP